jgi:hypothetical protein
MPAMKLAIVLLCAATSVALADKDTEAEKTAKAWFKQVLDGSTAPALGKKPLAYTIGLPTVNECADMTSGSATTAAVMTKLKTCLVAARKHFGGTATANIPFSEIKMDKFLGHFDPKARKAMQSSAAGLKIVESGINGDGETMTIYVGIGDGSVRLLWIDSEAVE